ncbi:SDR family oxidoreductase [Hyphomicrobium sp. D-2]|uniref:SDR family NAD(P)-dependent oxidoreductase n=1 Tax=Hyphomicrobium sp. D-2 TaxID=3041621 RepID=UPI002456484F|nr:SDR family oxidoreductase [Hyphomicrobium sp. D-2]MDH4981698.1 SDR family NAD(P)-dependent oxidoreductase [Hyphomicrobium sp. D-2]
MGTETKVAVITGASSGIGRAIAERFLENGYRLALMARSEEGLLEIKRKSLENVIVVPGDVTKAESLDRLVEQAIKTYGAVDVIIPNAGAAKVVPFTESGPDAIAEQFNLNFVAATETVRKFLPHIAPQGSVIFITTFLTTVGFPGLAIYNSSKAALKSFAQTLAVELAPQGIRVNSIAPGPIGTPLWGKVGLPADVLASVAEAVNARLMPGRFGEPADIADTALFLASPGAKNIYGQEIVVDGGYTIG